jgi:Fur family ferric uptake transcriptional regulator
MIKNNAQMIQNERVKFLCHLIKTGRRMSKSREVIFDEVMGVHEHFSTEWLVKKCLQKKLDVSRPTVYRVLRDLLEARVIRETAFGDKHQHFEPLYEQNPHHHALCIRCHNFLEFPDRKEEISYHPSLKKQGFRILGHEMHFYGICRECQIKEV